MLHQGKKPTEYRPTEYRTSSRQPSLVTDRQTHTRSDRTVNSSNPKLPAFNGKDDWKVWINRFEAIARRRSWTEEEKLDELLPRIQGEAGNLVFTQLPVGVLDRYTDLVRELSYRYRVIENTKSFKVRFSSRNQKPREKAEEYAAELKRLHHKAYPNRDRQQRKEDLLERFMRGILDEEVRFFVNYVKKPDDIDEAVYLVVECLCERRSNKFKEPNERRSRENVRRASSLYECSDSEKEIEGGEEETCMASNIMNAKAPVSKRSDAYECVREKPRTLHQKRRENGRTAAHTVEECLKVPEASTLSHQILAVLPSSEERVEMGEYVAVTVASGDLDNTEVVNVTTVVETPRLESETSTTSTSSSKSSSKEEIDKQMQNFTSQLNKNLKKKKMANELKGLNQWLRDNNETKTADKDNREIRR
ncbi:unnamed protein product [Mytilus edulis]|uniref:Retrotransposon gag domain-containing protein n=1 Tax=Mytilus edulis TaxID=6550 RepID=A0A8S3S251_MYTED|nr:unnamed protein product [Mytilus edulis]